MGRAPCCDKIGLKKGPWTTEEDEKLASYISQHGVGSWRALPKRAGLLRCGKSCRLRWTNYLRPDIKRGEFTAPEEQTIIQLHALLGNRWSAIANHLPKRTDNEIKNYWNTHLKKRLVSMGLDPATHKPKVEVVASCGDSSFMELSRDSHTGSSLNHMAQWESARLEAEARLAKETSLRAIGLWPTVPSKPACCDASPSKPKPGTPILLLQACSDPKASIPSKYEALVSRPTQDIVPSKGLSANELINTLQNWENSLQGQAGLMWPESWSFSTSRSAIAEGPRESSSCSSPLVEQLHYGSPTSTLCSLDHASKRVEAFNHSSSTSQAKKLSWSAVFQEREPRSCRSEAAKSSPCVGFDGLRGGGGERSLSSMLAFMQEGVHHLDGLEILRGEESAHNSCSLLDELELVSEDISSAKSSSINSSSEEISDNYWDSLLVDSPRQAGAQESLCM